MCNYICFKLFLIFEYVKKGVLYCFKKLIKDESGMGTIEVIIIMAVLVALALIFRTYINDLANTIFTKITEKTDAIVDSM